MVNWLNNDSLTHVYTKSNTILFTSKTKVCFLFPYLDVYKRQPLFTLFVINYVFWRPRNFNWVTVLLYLCVCVQIESVTNVVNVTF